MKNAKVRVGVETVDGFFSRSRDRARKLDRGEKIAPEIIVSFEDPADMLRVLSAQRVRVLRLAKMKSMPVSDLAGQLKRDTRAVSRDVDLLEEFGLLRSRYETNPGHGRRRIVDARASKYQLQAVI